MNVRERGKVRTMGADIYDWDRVHGKGSYAAMADAQDQPGGERLEQNTGLTAFLNARLDENEAAAKAAQLRFPGPWDRLVTPDSPLPSAVSLYDSRDESFGVIRGSYAAEHIVRHDPARVLREVEAGRARIAGLLRRPPDFNPSDEHYSCSQAVSDESDEPGSGCSDPDRRGQPCDCGRDASIERMLRIDAAIWSDHPDYQEEWKP